MRNIDNLIQDIYELIYKEYGNIDTNDLNDIVLELIRTNIFTSNDSVDSLIDMLKAFKEGE
jgi:hypothetical protein